MSLRFFVSRGSFEPVPPLLMQLLVLGGKKVEQQAIVGPAIDVMALPLSADETEAEPLYGPERGVVFHGPGIDRAKAEIAKCESHQP